MGYKAVSAQAAFYGLSQALIPETDFDKKKQKFLKDFKAEELLYQSHFKLLAKFISEELLKNSRAKIIQSNCNKALKVVEKLQKAIAITIDRQIDPTIKEIKDKQKETYSNLDHSRDEFVSNLNNSVFKEIERFKSDLREEMYEHIDRGIENKECEEIFENERKQRTEKLRENIKKRFEQDGEQFRKDLQKDAEQFEERIKNSLVMLNRINTDSGFSLIFNTHSGINKIGLFASIGGLILLLATPLGGIALAAGIILGAIGIFKSVWSFFDSDYKKSQQRKEVDKNLDKFCGIIEERVRNQIEDAKKGICEKVENIKIRLNNPVVCYERMREGLIKAGESLWQISNNIKTRIAQ